MRRTVQFTVPGEPVPKGRPIVSTLRGRPMMRTPEKTERYENRVAMFAQQAMAGGALLDGALVVTISVYLPIPASWSGKKRARALALEIFPTSRPDLDNLTKAVGDGCNKVIWTDDSRIVDMHATKRFSDSPRLEVLVSALEGRDDIAT